MNAVGVTMLSQRSGFLFMALAMLFLIRPDDAAAQAFIGNYCWNFTITDTTVTGTVVPSTFVMRSDITAMGGNSYTLIGHVNVAGDNPFTLSGFGHVIGTTLYLDLSGSQSHATGGWRDTSAIHATIDVSTYTGTFYDIGNDYNAVTRVPDSTRYTAGTVALSSSCP